MSLERCAEEVRAGAPSLVRALLDRATVDRDDVTRVAADQATDAVCELLRWSAGTFSFVVGEEDPDSLQLGLRADELVTEGQRRMQVWPSLTTHIPSPDTVLRLATSRRSIPVAAARSGVCSPSSTAAVASARSSPCLDAASSELPERWQRSSSVSAHGQRRRFRPGRSAARQDIIAALEGHRPSRRLRRTGRAGGGPRVRDPRARADTSVAEPSNYGEDLASPQRHQERSPRRHARTSSR